LEQRKHLKDRRNSFGYTALSDMSNYEQVIDDISYMQEIMPLNEEEREFITKVTEIINSSIAIPCTA